nr:hypothetical protein [Pandoravirus aubagnensis]
MHLFFFSNTRTVGLRRCIAMLWVPRSFFFELVSRLHCVLARDAPSSFLPTFFGRLFLVSLHLHFPSRHLLFGAAKEKKANTPETGSRGGRLSPQMDGARKKPRPKFIRLFLGPVVATFQRLCLYHQQTKKLGKLPK